MPDDFIDETASPETADELAREASDVVSPIIRLPPAGLDLQEHAARIRYQHRQRQFAMEQRKAMDNALGAFLRVALGWSKALPKDERDAIAKRAKDLVAIGEKVARENAKPEEKRKSVEGQNTADYREWAGIIRAQLLGRRLHDEIEKETTKRMAQMAEQLPVWAWAKNIRGFGAVSLAQIVAETGLVSCDKHSLPEDGNYPSPARIWKRMGVAVLDGVRQGGLKKTAKADEWISHGYSCTRRSIMWNIGEALKKLNDGEYRECYLARKQYERDRAEMEGLEVVPAAKIAKLSKDEKAKYRTLGHIDNRARRYMEKRLLRNLWRAWREAARAVDTKTTLPPANPNADAIAAE